MGIFRCALRDRAHLGQSHRHERRVALDAGSRNAHLLELPERRVAEFGLAKISEHEQDPVAIGGDGAGEHVPGSAKPVREQHVNEGVIREVDIEARHAGEHARWDQRHLRPYAVRPTPIHEVTEHLLARWSCHGAGGHPRDERARLLSTPPMLAKGLLSGQNAVLMCGVEARCIGSEALC